MVQNTTSPTNPLLLAAYSLALGRRAVLDLLDGSGVVYIGGASLVDSTLFCQRCREMTTARCRLDAWFNFDADLRDRRLNCSCGGVLTRDLSPIISLEQAAGA